MSPRLKRMFDEWAALDKRRGSARGKQKTKISERKNRVGGIISRMRALDDKRGR